jgi:hypothetical protein
MKKAAAAQQLKAFALCINHPLRDHRPQGGNPNEVQPQAVLERMGMKKGSSCEAAQGFCVAASNLPKGSPTAGR